VRALSSFAQEPPLSRKLTLEELKKYLQVVSEINAISFNILEWCRRNIWSVVGESQAREAKIPFDKWSDEVRRIVISGLKVEQLKNPYYTPNAYAMFIKDFIGLYLENPALYVENLMFKEEMSNVNIVFEKTLFIEFVEYVYRITEFILKKASELGIRIEAPKAVEGSIDELIERFLQKVYEVTVGVNSFTTAVWGLRKITPSYMKKAYGEVPQQLLDILDFKKLLEVKYVELWGFKDYFTQLAVYCIYDRYPAVYHAIINNVPISQSFLQRLSYVNDPAKRQRILTQVTQMHQLSSLGGAICALNQAVWSYISRLREICVKWFRDYVDLESLYVGEAWEKLGEQGWKVPEYLRDLSNDITPTYAYFERGLMYDEVGVVNRRIALTVSYCECSYSDYTAQFTLLARLLYDLMPAIFLGVADVTLKIYLCGRSSGGVCRNIMSSDVLSLSCEDVDAVAVFFRRATR
jgi:hypothetical protein